MQARFSFDPPEIEFQGDKQDYTMLSSLLKKHSGVIELAIHCSDPAPYQRLAVKLAISEVSDQKASISVDNSDVIMITGDRQCLDALGDNIESFGLEAQKGDHSHEEYFEDHFYLTANSMPCILSMISYRS